MPARTRRERAIGSPVSAQPSVTGVGTDADPTQVRITVIHPNGAITTSDPMITDARDSLGSRRLRMSKMVLNSGYPLPLRRCLPSRRG